MRIRINLRNFLYYFASTFYATVIAYFTDILGYEDFEIKARSEYLSYFEGIKLFFISNFETQGIVTTLVNDSLFFFACYALGLIFTPRNGLRLLIFLSSFFICNFILRNKNGKLFYNILFLINPLLFFIFITDVRQAVAMSIFLISFNNENKIKRIGGFILASAMHSGYFLISFFYIFSQFLMRFKSNIYNKTLIFFTSYLGFTISFFSIASIIPARQIGEYAKKIQYMEMSSLGFILWFIILCFFLIKDDRDLNKNSTYIFSIGIIIFYLVSYYFLPFSMRVLEASLPLILISTNYLKSLSRQTIVFLISLQGLYIFLFKVNEFLLASN